MGKNVYFAFHYQDVIDFRANTVRNHNLIAGAKAAGYYDHSIWEESKRTSTLALKRLINSELEGTSVTAVLIGSDTHARPWVRYEIMKSVSRGNKVIGIHINGIAGKDQKTKLLGINPFLFLGLQVSKDGLKGEPTVWNGKEWTYYTEVDPFVLNQQPVADRDRMIQVSHWCPCYDWVADNGYANFDRWIA